MRKVIGFLVLFFISVSLSAKPKGYLSARIISPKVEGQTNKYEDDTIKVSFFPHRNYLEIEIFNKTKERIYIEWENARIGNSAVAFGTDIKIKIDEPKANEVVYPESYSIRTELFPKNNIDSKVWMDIDEIQKKGEKFCNIILPVIIGEKTKDYIFKIGIASVIDGVRSKISIPTKDDLLQIKEGMTFDQVSSKIGYAYDYICGEDTIVARYLNGAEVRYSMPSSAYAKVLIQTTGTPSKKQKVIDVDYSKIHTVDPIYSNR